MKYIYKLSGVLLGAIFAFSCSDDEDKERRVEQIEITSAINDTIRLFRYDQFNLDVKTYPDQSSFKCISTNTNVFKVDDNGNITAVDGGVASLVVVAANGEGWTKKTYVVDVTSFVEEISLSSDNLIISASHNVAAYFVVSPESAANKKITYSSSDPSIAAIDEKGMVTSLRKGIVEITATSTDGDGTHSNNVSSKPMKIYSKYSRTALPKTGWTVTAINYQDESYAPDNIIDGSTYSFWHCTWSPPTNPPYWLLIDMKVEREFDEILLYRCFFSNDTRTVEYYTSPVLTDNLPQDDPSFVKIGTIDFGDASRWTTNKTIKFFPEIKHKSRYLKLFLPDTNLSGNNSIAEITLYNVE